VVNTSEGYLSPKPQELNIKSPDFSGLNLNESQNKSFQIGIEDIFFSLTEEEKKKDLKNILVDEIKK
jgi:hypothetical protein